MAQGENFPCDVRNFREMKGLFRICALFLVTAALLPCMLMAQDADPQLPLLNAEEQKNPGFLKAVFVSLSEKNRPDLALPYMEAFMAMDEKNGATPGERLWIRLQMADGYRMLGREEEAVASIVEAVSQARSVEELTPGDFQDFLYNAGNILYTSGHQGAAESLYLELLRAGTLRHREERELAICLNLFTWYGETGQYQKLRPVLEKLIPWLGPVSTPEQQAGHYHTLGLLYSQEGAYDKAEKNLLEAVSLYKKVPGAETSEAEVTMQLATDYMKMGDPDRSLRLAEEVRKSPVMEKESTIERSYQSLKAVHALLKGEYRQAESLYNQLLENAPRGGIRELDYASDQGTLGTIHWYLREYPEAEEKYLEAIRIFRATGDTTWSHFANFKGNLGLVYLRTGAFRRAAEWSASATASFAALQRDDHPDCLTHRINGTIALEGAGDITMALGESLRNNRGLRDLVGKNLLYWSEHEMESFMSGFANRFFDAHHSLWFRNISSQPSLAGEMYDNQLFLKGILLQSVLKLQQALASGSDTLLTLMAAQSQEIRKQLEQQLSLPPGQRQRDPAQLREEEDLLLKKMKELINELPGEGLSSFGMLTNADTGFRDVRDALQPGEAALEFLSFRNSDPWHESDTTWYCALLLRKGDTWPLVRFLTTGDRLEKLLALHPDEMYYPENKELTTLLWEPLEKELQGITTLYYSPSGLLHRVSMAALPTGGGKVLSDRLRLVNLSSTRNLIQRKTEGAGASGMVFGGINYNSSSGKSAGSMMPSGEGTPGASAGITPSSGRSEPAIQAGSGTVGEVSAGVKGYEAGLRNLHGIAWDFLPGTQVEATRVSQLLGNHQLPVTLLTGPDATEERFKALSGASPAIIHLASHGFSLPPADREMTSGETLRPTAQEVITTAGIPLMRSGLLLAGANQAWASGIRNPGLEDGILTAWEISHLDLSATHLAVLSACQTGLGEIRGSEGVYGLQRALFMAGTHSMVVSLWEVPDLETIELMERFYRHMTSGNDPETAFLKARDEMKQEYRNQPSLWAGFDFIR